MTLAVSAAERDCSVVSLEYASELLKDIPHSEITTLTSIRNEAVLGCTSQLQAAMFESTELFGATPSDAITRMRRLHARELVFRYGWNVTAYQILNPDVLHWFTQDGEGVVGYVRHFRTRVAAGAPVCDERRLAEIAQQFEDDAATNGETVCWFAATTRLQNALVDAVNHTPLVVGAQPVWNPQNWESVLVRNASLRAQINRARNKGVSTSEWSTETASDHPKLQRCLDDWIASHAMPKLRFLTEPVTLDRLLDRRIFVAEMGGVPHGYLIATPVPSRNGWLVEQIVRGRLAPNGTAELLVDSAMRALAEDGYTYITLGLVPLTQREQVEDNLPRLWLRVTLSWARLHGSRFYNFEGLDTFKAKFDPEAWEPIMAISNERFVTARTVMAIVAAFSDGPIYQTALRALYSAASQELIWMTRRGK